MQPMIGPHDTGSATSSRSATTARSPSWRSASPDVVLRRVPGGSRCSWAPLAIASLVVHRKALVAQWDVAVVLGVAVVGLLALLNAVAYRAARRPTPLDLIIAGRYLLPLAALYGIGVALAGIPGAGALGGGGRRRGGRRARPAAAELPRNHRGALLCVGRPCSEASSCSALGFAVPRRPPLPRARPRHRSPRRRSRPRPDGAGARRVAERPARVPRQGGDGRALGPRADHRLGTTAARPLRSSSRSRARACARPTGIPPTYRDNSTPLTTPLQPPDKAVVTTDLRPQRRRPQARVVRRRRSDLASPR